jgi:hypothetical protein
MRVKPKFRLGQKVIFLKSKYFDGKYDIGYVVGISVKRSYSSCGMFQNGGLSTFEIHSKGLLKTYVDNIDEACYEVIHQLHTRKDHAICKKDSYVNENEIVPYTVENKKKYPVDE